MMIRKRLEFTRFIAKLQRSQLTNERSIYESSEEDRKAHTAMVKKQAEEILNKEKEL